MGLIPILVRAEAFSAAILKDCQVFLHVGRQLTFPKFRFLHPEDASFICIFFQLPKIFLCFKQENEIFVLVLPLPIQKATILYLCDCESCLFPKFPDSGIVYALTNLRLPARKRDSLKTLYPVDDQHS